MKIKLTSVYVDDQEKALHFYTDVLGLVKRTDVSNGPYRWLTVGSPEEPDGAELQLALNDNPAARTYQQALFQQGQPAVMLFTDDVQADYERMKAARGRVHHASDPGDGVHDRPGEGHLRQPGPADAVDLAALAGPEARRAVRQLHRRGGPRSDVHRKLLLRP